MLFDEVVDKIHIILRPGQDLYIPAFGALPVDAVDIIMLGLHGVAVE